MFVEVVEIGVSEIAVADILGKHVIDGDQDLMGDRYSGALVPAPRLEAIELVPPIAALGPGGRIGSLELERVDLGKMNLQLKANEQNQDRAQCGKNESGGMISFGCRARKHVGYGAADDRSDDAEHDRPEDRHMHVHHRSCNNPRD